MVDDALKSLCIVDVIRSLFPEMSSTLPLIAYVVSKLPTRAEPSEMTYEFVASLVILMLVVREVALSSAVVVVLAVVVLVVVWANANGAKEIVVVPMMASADAMPAVANTATNNDDDLFMDNKKELPSLYGFR